MTVDQSLFARYGLVVPALVILAVCLVVAAYVRVHNAHSLVFVSDDRVELLGVDSYFHLRHAERLVDTMPHVERRDMGTHFPRGMVDNATGLFGLSIAAAAKLTSPDDEMTTVHVARVAAWAPVIFGVLSYVLVFIVGWLVRGPIAAATATLLYLAYPGYALNRSLLGFADHHVLEYTIGLGILAGIVWTIGRRDGSGGQHRWLPAFGPALPLAMLFATWRGAPLFLVDALVVIGVIQLVAIARHEESEAVAWILFRYGLGFVVWYGLLVMLWPSVIVDPGHRYVTWILAAGAVMTLGPLAAVRVTELLVQREWKEPVVALSFLATTAVGVWTFFAQTRSGVAFAGTLFGVRGDEVLEQGVVTASSFVEKLGGSGVLAVFALLPLMIAGFRRGLRYRDLAVVVFGAMTIFFWVRTHDFGYTPPPFAALAGTVGVFVLYDLLGSLRKRIRTNAREQRKRRQKTEVELTPVFSPRMALVISTAAGLVLAILPVWPIGMAQKPYLGESEVRELKIYTSGWFEAMEWMAENTPDPYAGSTGDDRRPSYGVMSAWDFGNVIGAYGHRVPLYSRYPNAKEGKWMLMRDEDSALKALCHRCSRRQRVRYVIADAWTAGEFFGMKARYAGTTLAAVREGEITVGEQRIPHMTFGSAFDSSMVARLYDGDGSGFSRLRQVFASAEDCMNAYLGVFDMSRSSSAHSRVRRTSQRIDTDQRRVDYEAAVRAGVIRSNLGYVYDAVIEPSVKVFEVVEGARIVGSTDPGSKVEVSLPLRDDMNDRSFTYRQSTLADAGGSFAMTVPYATSRWPGATIQPASEFELQIVDSETGSVRFVTKVSVRKAAVRRGRTITIDHRRR